MADDRGLQGEGTLILEQRFAIVPEWIIDAQLSDCAFRLYAVLLRYGQSSGQRMPGRALLARRLHKASTDTVDRALKELVAVGAVVVERRRSGRQNLTNRYHLRTTRPGPPTPQGTGAARAGGRTGAATPGRTAAATPGGRRDAATPGRTDAGRVAAPVRPDPEVLTEKEPPPTPPPPATAGSTAVGERSEDAALLAACGIDDLPGLAEQCQQLRRRLGLPASRWTAPQLLEVLRQAVRVQGHPARAAAAALLAIAADPTTRSPVRLGYDGPWWDTPDARPRLSGSEVDELDQLEARLREADGRRVWLQQRARSELLERGEPLTRLQVARHACKLLDEVELTPC